MLSITLILYQVELYHTVGKELIQISQSSPEIYILGDYGSFLLPMVSHVIALVSYSLTFDSYFTGSKPYRVTLVTLLLINKKKISHFTKGMAKS